MFYLHLFTTPNHKTRTYWIIRSLMVFFMLFYLTNLPVAIWPCVPRSRLWTPTEAGHCINYKVVFITLGTINAVANFFLLILPISQIRWQHMSRRRKIGVSFIFIIGLLYVNTLNLSMDGNWVADRGAKCVHQQHHVPLHQCPQHQRSRQNILPLPLHTVGVRLPQSQTPSPQGK